VFIISTADLLHLSLSSIFITLGNFTIICRKSPVKLDFFDRLDRPLIAAGGFLCLVI